MEFNLTPAKKPVFAEISLVKAFPDKIISVDIFKKQVFMGGSVHMPVFRSYPRLAKLIPLEVTQLRGCMLNLRHEPSKM